MYKFQACQSGRCAADYSNGTHSSLDTWKIVCVTATKFEPFVFPMLGLVFSSVWNIYTIVSLYDFCLLPTYFCYVIVNVQNPANPM
jgi:hypothetical protein